MAAIQAPRGVREVAMCDRCFLAKGNASEGRVRVISNIDLTIAGRKLCALLCTLMLALVAGSGSAPAAPLPNVVLILADDLGIGDVSAFFPDALTTPNLDALARNGVAFLQARAAASVCTPSRYALLTGRHLKSTWLGTGIVRPYGSTLVRRGAWTLPQMFRWRGYTTAMVGKNHLGIDWHTKNGPVAAPEQVERDWRGLALNRPYARGPLDLGFDSYFGVDVPNYPPYAWISDRQIIGSLTS